LSRTSGIFANWWEDLKYDFKTIVSTGWSKNLIEDESIKEKFFKSEMEKIEELEGKIAGIDGELNELLDKVEEWDEEEQGKKTVNKVRKYLKDIIEDLRAGVSESGLKEAERWETLMWEINEKEKELKKFKRELSNIEKEIEEKIKEKRKNLNESEAKELLLEKFYEHIENQLNKYLNEEKKEIIKIFEKLWDKYKVSLSDITEERDKEMEKLEGFLKKLGYYYDRS